MLHLDGIGKIAKHIPGLKYIYNSLRQSLDNLILSQEKRTAQGRRDRAVIKQQRLATKELSETIKEAKESTKQYTQAEADLTNVKLQNIKVTEDQEDAEQKLIERRDEFEQNYIDRLRESSSTKLELLEHEKTVAFEKAEKLGASKLAVEEYYRLESEKLNNESLQRIAEKEQEFLKNAADFAISSINRVGQIQDHFSRNKLTLNLIKHMKSHQLTSRLFSWKDRPESRLYDLNTNSSVVLNYCN